MSDPTIYAQLAAMEKRLKALERQESGGLAGTWTPTLTGTGTPGTYTYAARVGVYVRLGNVVIVHCYVNISAIGVSPTLLLTVTGLPFTALGTANAFQALETAQTDLVTLAAGSRLGAYVAPSTTTITLTQSASAATAVVLPATAITANSSFLIGGSYIAA